MGFHLKIMNYRGIRSVDFNPDGVCLLVGPNGSGKSTLLSVIELLRNAFERGFDMAINMAGGPWGFTNFELSENTSATFILELSDLRWELNPTVNSGGAVYPISETVKQGKDFLPRPQEDIIADAILAQARNDESRAVSPIKRPLILTRLYDTASLGTEYENFVQILRRYRNYHDYHLWQLRKSGSQAGSDLELQSRGQNAFSVLRNWHTSRPLRERYEFVINGLREAFPLFFDDLDFESAGQTVTIRIYPPHSNIPVPIYFASNGFLAAMLHLMAVCSAPDGGIIGIDEPENSLHPYAIKTLIHAFQERAEEQNLTLLLATHSPFVLNEFKEEAHRVYVMEQNEKEQLVRLDKVRDPEWLKYFSLGDLYGSEFGRQEEYPKMREAE
ncbi:AAA family ATPase [Desulfonema magnum]|uniref:AAA ATPase domain-containing protein n=1 Tax=Desulfonema magnum TaxID=45655 RepID=A0A975BF84_9BACT|nr:AAA family ATPase [Desulfonema magnum]QTA84218.1 AAA ATPase domain-containing protein [Desulfonema magnum]